jgi:hypothetical protein
MMGMVRSLPVVSAPRNFILDPARMAAKPPARRRATNLYPTLRLATTAATLLFMIVFAGDLIMSQALSAPAAQPVTLLSEPAMQPTSAAAARAAQPTSAPETFDSQQAPAEATQVTQPTAPPEIARSTDAITEGATPPSAGPGPAAPGPGAGGAVAPPETPTEPLTNTLVISTPTLEPSPTPAAIGEAPPAPEVLSSEAEEQANRDLYSYGDEEASPEPLGPVRIVEIGLAVLIVLLGTATILAWRAS